MKTNKPRIIGITGKAGVGKDTAAAFLVKTFGYTRYAFADPIKELLNARFGWTTENWEDRHWKENPQVLIPKPTGDHWLSPRQLAQWLGTEVGRNIAGPNCWVDVFQRWYRDRSEQRMDEDRVVHVEGPYVVIPDVRFNNEAEMIRYRGGKILKIHRSNVEEVASHVSEKGINSDLIDWNIDNRDSIADLHFYLAQFVGLK